MDLVKLGDEVLERIERRLASIGPIYQFDTQGRSDVVGTAVFFRHEEQHVILTAGHVLTRLRGKRVVGGEKTPSLILLALSSIQVRAGLNRRIPTSMTWLLYR